MIILVDEKCLVGDIPVVVTQLEPYQRKDEWFLRVSFYSDETDGFIYDREFLGVAQDLFDKYVPVIANQVPPLGWTESGMQEKGRFHFIAGVW